MPKAMAEWMRLNRSPRPKKIPLRMLMAKVKPKPASDIESDDGAVGADGDVSMLRSRLMPRAMAERLRSRSRSEKKPRMASRSTAPKPKLVADDVDRVVIVLSESDSDDWGEGKGKKVVDAKPKSKDSDSDDLGDWTGKTVVDQAPKRKTVDRDDWVDCKGKTVVVAKSKPEDFDSDDWGKGKGKDKGTDAGKGMVFVSIEDDRMVFPDAYDDDATADASAATNVVDCILQRQLPPVPRPPAGPPPAHLRNPFMVPKQPAGPPPPHLRKYFVKPRD